MRIVKAMERPPAGRALMQEDWFRRLLTRLRAPALARMLRRLGLAAGLGAAALLAGAGPVRAANAPRPNIVFILADDLGIGDVGAYGQQDVLTPNIDRLAADGMLFSSVFCPATICTPSRCGLMTGFHGGHMTSDRNDGSLGTDYPLRAEDITVAEVLQQGGYATGFFGKWGMGPGTNNWASPTLVPAAIETLPTRQGFDETYGYLNQGRAHDYDVPSLWQDDPAAPEGVSLSPTGGVYTHDLIAARAEQFIADHAGGAEPFYLQASFTPPHFDIDAVPPQWREPYLNLGWADKKVKSAAMITHLDAAVGQLIARIEDPDGDGDTSDSIAADTVILFASDNGPAKEDGSDPAFFNSNGPYRGWKRDLYDGGVRTPLIVRWDGVVAAGSTSDHLAGLEDFLPTAAELAGVAAPAGVDGVSFAPTLTGTGTQRERDFLVWEFHEGAGGDTGARAARWAVLQDGWKLIYFEDGSYELYDTGTDTGEQNNVVAAHPDRRQQLEAIAVAEKLTAPKGYGVHHRDWTGGGAEGAWLDEANWSGTGLPGENWVATVRGSAARPVAAVVSASSSVLGLDLAASGGQAAVDVEPGRTLSARNGVRVGEGGALCLRNATLETVREVDVRPGGRLGGSGQVTGNCWNAGAVAPGQDAPAGGGAPGNVDTGVVRAVEFEFSGVQDDAPLTATTVRNENLAVVAGLDFGPGVGPRHPGGGSTDRGDEFNVMGFETESLAEAVGQNDYLTFTVAPVAGVAMRLDRVRINLWRNGVNAAEHYALMTSLDGFADGAELGQVSIWDSGIDNQHLFTAAYAGGEQITDTLEVRLYGWSGQSSGNTHVNAVSLDASFVSVPQQVLGPTGVLRLGGSYEQLDTGTLALDLTGRDNADPVAPGHDALHVAGDLVLDGALALSWLPSSGDANAALGGTYDLLVYKGRRTGAFRAIDAAFSAYILGIDYDTALADGSHAVRLTLADPLVGDADLDGAVDGDDLLVFQAAAGAERPTWLDGDFNCDAVVDHLDYLLWKANVGAAVPPANTPEPATLLLITAGAMAVLLPRRRG